MSSEVQVVDVTEGDQYQQLPVGNHHVRIHGEFRTNNDGWYCLAVGVLDSKGKGTGLLNVTTEAAKKKLTPLLGDKSKALAVRAVQPGMLYLQRPKS
mgnify:CR=1 FL=1